MSSMSNRAILAAITFALIQIFCCNASANGDWTEKIALSGKMSLLYDTDMHGTHSFRLRRCMIVGTGQVNPKMKATVRAGLNLPSPLMEASVKYDATEKLSVSVGKFPIPFLVDHGMMAAESPNRTQIFTNMVHGMGRDHTGIQLAGNIPINNSQWGFGYKLGGTLQPLDDGSGKMKGNFFSRLTLCLPKKFKMEGMWYEGHTVDGEGFQFSSGMIAYEGETLFCSGQYASMTNGGIPSSGLVLTCGVHITDYLYPALRYDSFSVGNLDSETRYSAFFNITPLPYLYIQAGYERRSGLEKSDILSIQLNVLF